MEEKEASVADEPPPSKDEGGEDLGNKDENEPPDDLSADGDGGGAEGSSMPESEVEDPAAFEREKDEDQGSMLIYTL